MYEPLSSGQVLQSQVLVVGEGDADPDGDAVKLKDNNNKA